MTRNFLGQLAEKSAGWKPATEGERRLGPPKAVVAGLSWAAVVGAYSIGKKGRQDIVTWLAEDGLSLRDMPTRQQRKVAPEKLEAAAALLRDHGYTVLEPPAAPNA